MKSVVLGRRAGDHRRAAYTLLPPYIG